MHVILIFALVGAASGCFCGPTCGCTGGYSGQSYPQAPQQYQQYYPQPYQPQYNPQNYAPAPRYGQGSYAVFYTDLSQFAQRGAQTPPLYVERPQQLQRPVYQGQNVASQYQPHNPVYKPSVPAYQEVPVLTQTQAPELTTRTYLHYGAVDTQPPVQGTFFTPEPEVETIAPAEYTTEAPIVVEEEPVVYTTIAPIVVEDRVVYTTQAPVVVTEIVAPVTTEQFDFDDVTAAPEKEEFYYVYYDNDGKRVGDSRHSTLPPDERALLVDRTPTEPQEVSDSTPPPTLITQSPEEEDDDDNIITFSTLQTVTDTVPVTTPETIVIKTVTFEPEVVENFTEDSFREQPVTLAPTQHETLAPSLEIRNPLVEKKGGKDEEIVYEDIEYEDDKIPDDKARAQGQKTESVRVDPSDLTNEIYKKRKAVKTQRGIRTAPFKKVHSN